MSLPKLVNKFLFFLIAVNIILGAYFLINGDIHFDVDVSRDFLVMDDIVRNNNPTLLGPRSGAILGIFHGPLWFYINLPAFIIGEGNPLIVGWFWFLLSVIFLGIIFYTAKKLFGFKVALLSVLFFSVNSIINSTYGLKNFYNPYGAVFLFPVFFLLFVQYINNLKVKYLVFSLFLLGLIIQFQMAFGIPILIAVSLYLSYFLFKKKKLYHFLSFFVLLIPLSTFILFDLKHDFLQSKALFQYFTEKNSLISVNRVNELFFNFFDQLSPGKNLTTIITALFFFIGFVYSFKKSTKEIKTIYWFFGYLFLSFWVLSLFYSGSIGNYFWPFLPLTIIIFCSFVKFIKQEVFVLVFISLYLINLYAGISAILDFKLDINERGPHSWAFNQMVARRIYQDAGNDFGYFNFSPDRYAYQQRYAMIYMGKYFPYKSFSSEKKLLTYLIEVDPPKDRPELNGISWRISDVKIDRSPDTTLRFDFILIEKYYLDNGEIEVVPNPYLLDSVFLR